MVSIEKAEEWLAELLDELPEAFFQELNGGVCLLPDAIRKPFVNMIELILIGNSNLAIMIAKCHCKRNATLCHRL